MCTKTVSLGRCAELVSVIMLQLSLWMACQVIGLFQGSGLLIPFSRTWSGPMHKVPYSLMQTLGGSYTDVAQNSFSFIL